MIYTHKTTLLGALSMIHVYITNDIIRDLFCDLHTKNHTIRDLFCDLHTKNHTIRDPFCDLHTENDTIRIFSVIYTLKRCY
jgi:hypothetical protein